MFFLSVGAHICANASVVQLCLRVGHPASLYIDSSSVWILVLHPYFSSPTSSLHFIISSMYCLHNYN